MNRMTVAMYFYQGALPYLEDVLIGEFPTKTATRGPVIKMINTRRVSICRSHQLCALFQEAVYPRLRKVAYTR